jgi:hypothetical protein
MSSATLETPASAQSTSPDKIEVYSPEQIPLAERQSLDSQTARNPLAGTANTIFINTAVKQIKEELLRLGLNQDDIDHGAIKNSVDLHLGLWSMRWSNAKSDHFLVNYVNVEFRDDLLTDNKKSPFIDELTMTTFKALRLNALIGSLQVAKKRPHKAQFAEREARIDFALKHNSLAFAKRR